MTTMWCTIGLDIGTTSIKAVAYHLTGEQIAEHTRHTETLHDEQGAAVQDADAIYESVMDVFRATYQTAIAKGYTLRAVGFSTAMHSLMPLSATGDPLMLAMTWMDARPGHVAGALWQKDIGKDIYTHTGTPIHAMTPIAKLAWLRQAHPDIFQKAKRFASIKEYVWFRWFGVWEIDYAMASATGMFDIEHFKWYQKALDYAEVTTAQLSSPVPTNHLAKAPTDERFSQLGVPADVVFCIGGSDGVLSNLAGNATTPDTMLLTVGTSLALRMGSAQPTVDVSTRSFCYVLDRNHYIVGGPSNNGGIMLDWLYRNVLTQAGEDFDRRFPELCEAAGAVEADALFCLPYVAGERAPLWQESATASFLGLQLFHRQEHLFRAAIEGMLFNAYWIGERLIDQLGKPDKVIVSGRLFQTAWVLQHIADLFGVEMHIQPDMDGATLGAVLLANQAAGLPEMSINRLSLQVVKPRMEEHRALQTRYRQYRALCDRLLDET